VGVPSPSPTRREFEEHNRAVLSDPRAVPDSDLQMWMKGRDELARQVLERQADPSRRRSPRAEVVVPGFLAGHGGVFTIDLSFEGVSFRVGSDSLLRASDVASVRLKVGAHSVYLSGRVAWGSRDRVGFHVEQVHPADKHLLQAAVCKRLLEAYTPGSPGGGFMGRRTGD